VHHPAHLFRRFVALTLVLGLTGCGGTTILHPYGPVANAAFHFTIISTAIMMVIILPTTVATLVFAFRYRKSNNAAYDPSFSHSMGLEFAMWGVPLLIVVILAFCTFESTFDVNPGGPTILDGASPAPALQVDVISTDWQWLFVYPQQRIATIDDLVVPQGQTVHLRLTSATVTNGFFIPSVAPMIDVMPGMLTRNAFRVDELGSYEGYSTDFSGAGFSWMQFSTRVLAPAAFADWVKQTQSAPAGLDMAQFRAIAKPTINEQSTPRYFSNVDPDLFAHVDAAVQQGEVFPVPMDVDSKAPSPTPMGGKPNQLKTPQ